MTAPDLTLTPGGGLVAELVAAGEQPVLFGREDLLATGVTYRQLDYWCAQGWLHPCPGRAPGPGNPRSFPHAELLICAAMVRLTTAGLTPATAHQVARTAPTSVTSVGSAVIVAKVAEGVRIVVEVPTT